MRPISTTMFIALALTLGCSSGGGAEQEDSPGPSPVSQRASGETPEASAIAQLNEACPEAWCMGDFKYFFQKIECTSDSCTLSFEAERDGEILQDSITFDHDDPLVDEFGDLDASYFERVTDALDEWEGAH